MVKNVTGITLLIFVYSQTGSRRATEKPGVIHGHLKKTS